MLYDTTMNEKRPVIFFDGVCGLCNGFVDFLIMRDPQARLAYSPLQSQYAAKHLSASDVQDLTSVVVIIDGKTWRKTNAVLRVVPLLGGLWQLAALALVIPRPIRDWIYDWVAQNRYRLFGKKSTCRLPTPEERARFLLD